jgi:ATP-dependent Lhr-like helicase
MQRVRPLLELQQKWSALPTPQTLLAETLVTREGTHLFLYPFAGRPVHMGLANLIAWRAAQHAPGTFSIAVNDYGLELLSADHVDWPTLLPTVLQAGHDAQAREAIALHGADEGERIALLHEVLASLNATELARRRFREIARVSGLIYQGYPGERRSNRQLQASSSLFYEVFRKYDPANRLLAQAEQELLSQELEINRMQASLRRMATQRLVLRPLARPTPFAFPLMVELFREKLSNENVADRIARMVAQLEKAAGDETGSEVSNVQAVSANLQFGVDAVDAASPTPSEGEGGKPRRSPERRRRAN